MSRYQNRIISAESIGSVTDWNFAAVDQTSLRFAAKLKVQAEEEARQHSETVRQTGHSEGFSEGYAQGHAQATLEGQRQISDYINHEGKEAATHFAALFDAAQQQLSASEQAIAKGVLELACEIARQVLRHELLVNPNVLQPVIRESLGMLLADGKTALVRMNPVDLDVLSDGLRQEFSTLSLAADAGLTRGSCLTEANGTVIDGTVERRWQRAVASLGLESAWEVDNDVH